MRRKDREIREQSRITELLEQAKTLRMALFDDVYPYIIPMHYGFELLDGKTVFYMHCAKAGHKLELIGHNSAASIEIEGGVEPVSGGEIPCEYGALFASVIACGHAEILENSEEKIHALEVLMKHQTGRAFVFDEKMADAVAVIRFTADSCTAKARVK